MTNSRSLLTRLLPVGLFLAVLVLGILLGLQRHRLADAFSLADTIPFETISKVAMADDGTYAVVFDSNKRIALVEPDGSLDVLIHARNVPERGFYFATELVFGPDGSLYVASTYIDTETLAVNRECIVRFSPRGRHEAVLYSIDHETEDYIDNIGVFRSLDWTPDGLRFCVVGDGGVQSLLLDPQTGAVLEDITTPVPEIVGRVTYAAVTADGRQVAFTTAATEIYTGATGERPTKRYDGRDLPPNEYSMPADIHFLGTDIYFSDLGRDAIMQLVSDGVAEPVFNESIAVALGYQDDFYECKSFQIKPGHLLLPNNDKLVHMRTDEPASIHVLEEARGDEMMWIRRIAIWFQLLLLAASVLALLVLIIRNATHEGRRTARQVLLVAVMIGTAVSMTTYMIFTNMNQRLEAEAAQNLRGYLEMGRILVDADTVDRVRHVNHFMNEDYQNILQQLQQTITRDGSIDSSIYSGVYKVIDGKVTALAYHDGLYSIFYPYDYNYEESFYAQVAETLEPYIDEIVDIYGVWLVGVAPLINSAGDVVGFLEVGVDQSAQREANRSLFLSTLAELAMVLFVLIFIFFEIGFFSSHVFDHDHRRDETAMQRYDEGALRFVSFLAITGVFLSASFLPLFSQSLAIPIGPLPFDMVIGLPLVIETLSGAVIAVLYGHIRIKLGLKTDIVLGCLVVAGGMAATAMAATFQALIIARVIVGMGMGLLMISFRTYFLIESNAIKKEAGIIALTAGVVAGINTGSVSGGMLAARVGMQSVFWLQAGILVLAALVGLLALRNRKRLLPDHGEGVVSPFTFLRERAVWSFFIFAFLPITACGLFLGFLFPLFAAAQGLSTNEISLAFMLFGIGSVYLGPALTRLTTFLFGARRAMVFGALVMAGGLLLFAGLQTLMAAYITVILFGLTDSFIFNQGLSYFSSLPTVRRIGEDKAMGVYNVFESSGEALGPLAFGLAMGVGLGTGITAIAAALSGCALAFLALSHKRKDRGP